MTRFLSPNSGITGCSDTAWALMLISTFKAKFTLREYTRQWHNWKRFKESNHSSTDSSDSSECNQ